MKSVVIHAPGDLQVNDVDIGDLGPDQVRIAVAMGGICGSDLHYYHQGGFGTVRISEPMILGHEVAGTIEAKGNNVTNVAVGNRVSVNPSRPCGDCNYCLEGLPNHCLDMLFYGSAMRTPHVQGAFRETLVAESSQCHVIADDLPMSIAACAEPFSVALHSIKRAGELMGKKVLVTGCGPIGAMVVVAAKLHGALEVTATDVLDEPLARVAEVGADRTINVAKDSGALSEHIGPDRKYPKGYFDVMIEASGNEAAIRSGLEVLKPRGILVQLGLGGEVSIPQNMIVAKEIEVRGSFRFHEEFGWATELLSSKRVDVSPLVTDIFSVDDAKAAFDKASDRSSGAMKVLLAFDANAT